MKRVLSMTERTALSMSVRMSAYWALRSSRGTVIAARVGMAHMVLSPWAKGLRVHPALLFEQLFRGHVAPDARRRAHHDLARRDVLRHDRPGRDERVLAHRDARERDAAGADPAAAFHRDALEMLEA